LISAKPKLREINNGFDNMKTGKMLRSAIVFGGGGARCPFGVVQLIAAW
jgi:hypothetical protein